MRDAARHAMPAEKPVRVRLRVGLEGAVRELGDGLLAHPLSEDLRVALHMGELDEMVFYQDLLRLAFRSLFRLMAEERGLPLNDGLFGAKSAAAAADADAADSPEFRTNFGELEVEDLGSLYESLLDYRPSVHVDEGEAKPRFDLTPGGGRKRMGSYYTPPALVRELIEQALVPVMQERLAGAEIPAEKEMAVLSLRVCDPACGTGHFLLAAGRRLGQELARVRTGEDEPGPVAYRAALREVAANCLYGVDRDPVAVELCRVGLWMEGGGGESGPSLLGEHVKYGDSLVGPDPTPRPPPPRGKGETNGEPRSPLPVGEGPGVRSVLPFHWTVEFPEVFQGGGFDVVLGNPPFGNAIESRTARNRSEARYFAWAFPEIARGAYDRANLFLGRALQVLRPGGALGMICPRATASGRGSRGLRQFVEARAGLRVLWCPDGAQLFPGADVFVCLVVARAGVRSPAILVSTDPASARPRYREVSAPRSGMAGTWWQIVNFRGDELDLPLQDTALLGKVAALWAGCAAGAAYELRSQVEDSSEGPGSRLVTTGAVDRFKVRWGAASQRYLKRDYSHPRWPANGGTGAVARALDRQRRPKILVAGLSRVIEAALDQEGGMAGVVSTHVVVPLAGGPEAFLALLAVLNSAAFSFLFFQRFGAKQMSGGNCTVGKAELLETPVPADLAMWLEVAAADRDAAGVGGTGAKERARLWRTAAALAGELGNGPEGEVWSATDEKLHSVMSSLYGLTARQHAYVLEWWRWKSGKARAAHFPAVLREELSKQTERPGEGQEPPASDFATILA